MEKILLDKNWQYLESDLMNKLMLGVVGGWKTTTLPHDYSLELERSPDAKAGVNEGYMRHAGLYYKKAFNVDKAAAGKCFWLEFESVAGATTVWLNGEYIAKHLNPYTGILAEVSAFIKPGVNEIIVYTDNTNKPNSRWYTGCGITGHVWMHVGEQVAVQPWSLDATTLKLTDSSATLAIQSVIGNRMESPCDAKITYSVHDGDGTEVAIRAMSCLIPAGGAKAGVELQVKDITPWSPETPVLYTVSVTVDLGNGKQDTAVCRTGIRTVEVNPKTGLSINGKTVKMRGGCIHHDLGILGAAAHDAAIRRKLRLLKENGYNALRFAHNPYSPAYFDACDELGLLVVEEAFDEWVLGRTSHGHYTVFELQWEQDLEAMIGRDYNHPSIILWSTGNEVEERDGSADGFAWSKRLADKIRTLDSSRPVAVSACSLPIEYGQRPPEGATGNQALNMAFDNFESGADLWGDTTAPFFAPVDVAGYNYKTVRYAYDGEKFPQRVLYGSETYPRAAYDSWKKTLENKHVIGDFVWTAMDYLGESGVGRYAVGEERVPPPASWPWLAAGCSDLDLLGHKRPQSYYRDVVWHRDEKPHLFVLPPQLCGKTLSRLSWTWLPVEPNYTFPSCEDQPIEAHVYARADEVELFQNGESRGRMALNDANEFIAVFRLEYQPGTLTAVAYKNGAECGQDTLATTLNTTRIHLFSDRTNILGDGYDLCFVNILALDKEGHTAYTENGTVSLELVGDGELLAVGSAAPAPERLLPFKGNRVPLYQGRAMAVIRSHAGARGCLLKAAMGEAKPAEVTVGFAAVQQATQAPVQEIQPGLLDVPLSELMEDERAMALLNEHLPLLMNNPMLGSIKAMPLRKLAAMGGGMMEPEAFERLEEALASL